MSDFSSKCREYLKDTGENVYQLSAYSGLDRTSLQRMITGKRLPGIDFVRQFCDSSDQPFPTPGTDGII